MRDALLSKAFLASLMLHLCGFLVNPATSREGHARAVTLRVVLTPEAVPPRPRDSTPDRTPPAADAASVDATALPPAPPELGVERSQSGDPAPVEDDALPTVEVDPRDAETAPRVAAIAPPKSREPEHPPGAEPPPPPSAVEEEALPDPAVVEAFIREIEADRERSKRDRRYRFEIRERLVLLLQEKHPELRLAVEGTPSSRFRLRFRVDSEGFLYDLSLLAPPGTSPGAFDSLIEGLRRLSPLAPPPAPVGTPLTLSFVVEVR